MLMRGLIKQGKGFSEVQLRDKFNKLVKGIQIDPDKKEIARAIKAGEFGIAESKLKERLKDDLESIKKSREEAAKTAYELARLSQLQLQNTTTHLLIIKKAVELQPRNSLYRNELRNIHDEVGEFDKAIIQYDIALKICFEYRDNGSEVSVILNNKGLSFLHLAKYKDALETFITALQIAEWDEENNAALMADINGNIAGACLELGYINNARFYLNRAVPLRMVTPAEDKFEKIGGLILSAGNLYLQKNELEHALKCFNNALEFIVPKYGESHPSIGAIYGGIGNVHLQLKEYNKALEAFEKSLAIHENVFQPDHHLTVACYFNLGTCYGHMGNNTGALKYFQKSLEICNKIYLNLHADTAMAHQNLGVALSNVGNNEEGIRNLEISLQINNAVFSSGHQRIIENYINMAIIFTDQGNIEKALASYQGAHTMSIKINGPDHKDTLTLSSKIDMCREAL